MGLNVTPFVCVYVLGKLLLKPIAKDLLELLPLQVTVANEDLYSCPTKDLLVLVVTGIQGFGVSPIYIVIILVAKKPCPGNSAMVPFKRDDEFDPVTPSKRGGGDLQIGDEKGYRFKGNA